MPRRRHFKQTESLAVRLATFAKLMRERAERMAPGAGKSAVLAKAAQADATADINRWIRSSGLKSPECERPFGTSMCGEHFNFMKRTSLSRRDRKLVLLLLAAGVAMAVCKTFPYSLVSSSAKIAVPVLEPG